MSMSVGSMTFPDWAVADCWRGPQYDGKCYFYFKCYFFRTTPTNRDLREKSVYFPPRTGVTLFLEDNFQRGPGPQPLSVHLKFYIYSTEISVPLRVILIPVFRTCTRDVIRVTSQITAAVKSL